MLITDFLHCGFYWQGNENLGMRWGRNLNITEIGFFRASLQQARESFRRAISHLLLSKWPGQQFFPHTLFVCLLDLILPVFPVETVLFLFVSSLSVIFFFCCSLLCRLSLDALILPSILIFTVHFLSFSTHSFLYYNKHCYFFQYCNLNFCIWSLFISDKDSLYRKIRECLSLVTLKMRKKPPHVGAAQTMQLKKLSSVSLLRCQRKHSLHSSCKHWLSTLSSTCFNSKFFNVF